MKSKVDTRKKFETGDLGLYVKFASTDGSKTPILKMKFEVKFDVETCDLAPYVEFASTDGSKTPILKVNFKMKFEVKISLSTKCLRLGKIDT